MMERAVAEYERRMRKVYDKYVDGWIWPHEIEGERSRIIESLPLQEEWKGKREFLERISLIDRKLEKRSSLQILKRTLSPVEVGRTIRVYKDHRALRKTLDEIVDDSLERGLYQFGPLIPFFPPLRVPPAGGICPFALAKTTDGGVVCNYHEDVVDCDIVVPREVERPPTLWRPPKIRYECPVGGEVSHVPFGWDQGLHPCFSERVPLLRENQRPREALTPLGLACVRFPYDRKLIREFSPYHLQLVRDLDASDELIYVNLLSLEEAVNLLWKAFLKKPQPMSGL